MLKKVVNIAGKELIKLAPTTTCTIDGLPQTIREQDELWQLAFATKETTLAANLHFNPIRFNSLQFYSIHGYINIISATEYIHRAHHRKASPIQLLIVQVVCEHFHIPSDLRIVT